MVFFTALSAKDAVDEVRRTPGRLVVVAHLHLAEQSDSQHVQASQEKNCGKDHERAMLGHHIGVVQEFFNQQPNRHTASREQAEHPYGAEEV